VPWPSDPMMEEMVTNLDAEWVWHFRADLAGIPAGFAQCFDTAKVPQGAWNRQQPGTLGVDYFLGRTAVLGQGYGSRLLMEVVAYMTARWHPRRIIATPDRHNVRSVRAAPTCSFILDEETGLFVKEVHEAASPDAF